MGVLVFFCDLFFRIPSYVLYFYNNQNRIIMKAIKKVMLGLSLVTATVFASCNGCNNEEGSANATSDTTVVNGIVLVNGQTLDSDGNIVDKEGNIVKSADQIKGEKKTTSTKNTAATGPIEEKEFVHGLIIANTRQMALLEAGAAYCTNAHMRKGTSDMLAEHETLRNEINTFAEVHGYGLPNLDNTRDVAVAANAGAEWDKELAEKLSKNDIEIMNLLTRGKTSLNNADLQVVISDYLPKVQQHSSTISSWENHDM